MCRMASWVSQDPTTSTDALGTDLIERFGYLSTVHEDGWGAAWLTPQGELHTRRSALPAHLDPEFTAFADGVRAWACFLHVRLGTPGYGQGLVNVHPFAADGWAFAHNGAILPRDRLPGLLPPTGPRPRGQTDSEVYFLALLEHLRAGRTLDEAAGAVVGRVRELRLDASSMNAMLLDGATLAVISRYDPKVGDGGARVWPDDERSAGIVWPAYHPMSHTERPGFAAVVSSGLVPDPAAGGWAVLGNHTVWTATLDPLRVEQKPIAIAPPGRRAG